MVLTVIPEELEAARRGFDVGDGDREKDGDGTVYFYKRVPSALVATEYAVALLCIGSAGNPEAAAVTATAIARLKPRAALLMGIAAGMRGKVRIGDVVLSERVVAYEPAAVVSTGTATTVEHPRPDIERPPHSIVQDAVTYRPAPDRIHSAFVRSGGAIPTAPLGQEAEFAAHVATSITVRRSTIASGEKLLRDPAKLHAVRRLHGKVEVAEMEAAGFVAACRVGAVPWMIIRGISDFGDELKDDRFHELAACAASALLHDFVTHGLDLGGYDPPRVNSVPAATSVDGIPHDLIDVLADEYPDVRDARTLWERAGGRAGDVEQVGRPRDLWQRLWLRALNGAAVRPVELLQAALRDLPNNPVVRDYLRRMTG
jgi:nucleoside phosphorylase